MESTNQTQTVTMSLGDNIGVLLHQMSVENIFAYNPKKAVSLWVDSFHCSEEIARGLVFGKYICDIDPNDRGGVVVCNKSEIGSERLKDYYLFDPNLFLCNVIRDYRFFSEGEIESMELSTEYDDAWMKALYALEYDRSIIIRVPVDDKYASLGNGSDADLMSSVRQVVDFCLKNNRDWCEFEIDFHGDRKRVANALFFMRKCRELLDKKDGVMETLKFVMEHCPMDDELRKEYKRTILRLDELVYPKMESGLAYCHKLIDSVVPMNEKLSEKLSDAQGGDMLDTYLKKQKEIDNALNDFKPCDIKDKYDAGFIAPDGTFYGLNGTTANLLHLQLADAIMEREKITVPADFEYGKDFYLLGKCGYVKTCKDHIMHEGYSPLNAKPMPLTPAQKKAICEYGNTHYDGKLVFGLDEKRCTVERFKEIEDDVHLAELFGFDID